MSEVQNQTNKRFRPEDLGERDWWPRACVKMSFMYKCWLRSFLKYLVRCRIDAGTDNVTVNIDEQDVNALLDIIGHFDNARLIKSSVEPLSKYGGRDGNPRRR